MFLSVASLNSGSNGNCYYIGNMHEAILIDAGISCRETEKRMKRAGLSMQKVKAIFISHEHSDHINGVEVLSRRYQLPVYITENTLKNSKARIEKQLLRMFTGNVPVCIGDLNINPFPKQHDAADPYSFVVSSKVINVGVFTDIGTCCEHLVSQFKLCHAAFLETNYDELMLEQGRYPLHLKNRIRGGKGHLSNKQALELFITYRPASMSHLFLSHLSKDNNNPELVEALFSKHANGIQIIIASRYKETEVYKIAGPGIKDHSGIGAIFSKPKQISLF